jgi:hypothetical protein
MSPQTLNVLRRPPVRRILALLAVLSLLLAGFAQAAHFHKDSHKSEGARGFDTHLQCLLCVHADRLAGPPEVLRPPGQSLSAIALIIVASFGVIGGRLPRRYHARGPPRI